MQGYALILDGSSLRQTRHVWLTVTIALTLALYRISIALVDRLAAWLSPHTALPVAEWITHALFVWVLCLLWVSYRAWRAVAVQMRELENVISSINPDVLAVVDPNRVVRACTETCRRMFGYEPREIIGRKTDFLYDDRRPAGSSREIYEQLRNVGFHVGEAMGRRRDGEKFPLEIITGKLKSGGGAVLVMRDISGRVEAARQREQVQKHLAEMQRLESLGGLAGGVAHEFNNMLMAVLGNVHLAVLETAEGSPLLEHLRQIEGAAKRAAELTEQLVVFSGGGGLSPGLVSVNTLIRQMQPVVSLLQPKKAEVVYNLAEDLPPLAADPNQVRQVVVNLVQNAVEAIGSRKGTVWIGTGCLPFEAATFRACTPPVLGPHAETYAYIEVRDDGAGMSEPVLRRAFEPFYTTRLSGRGLGLSAVLGIARALGGCVRIESEPGCGTAVRVFFALSGDVLPGSGRRAESGEGGVRDERPR